MAARLGGPAARARRTRGTAGAELLHRRLDAVAAGRAGLLHPGSLAVCEERRLEFAARRALVLEGLDALGLPVPVVPDGAFYVYFDVRSSGLDAGEFCARALAEHHVALTPGRDFASAQGTAQTHVRLSYAASRAELTEGLRRIGEFLSAVSATSTRASATQP